jgi:septum formation protein
VSPPLLGPGAAATRLILASGSATRAALLHNAGLAFEQIPAAVDEEEIKRAMRAEAADAAEAALALAEMKAQRVAPPPRSSSRR